MSTWCDSLEILSKRLSKNRVQEVGVTDLLVDIPNNLQYKTTLVSTYITFSYSLVGYFSPFSEWIGAFKEKNNLILHTTIIIYLF